jgi:LCP family protein required for cell wall assembly
LLSFIFPGLGQAYLGRPRDALRFGLPVIVVLLVVAVFVITSGGLSGAGARALDPAIAFPAAIVVFFLGAWWILAILHAWRNGARLSSAAIAVPLALVFVVGVADVFGATSLYRMGNAGIAFTDPNRDPTTNEGLRPSARPTAPPTPAGQTADPQATHTQPPPDVQYPEDSEPPDEPSPSLAPGPTPGYDITEIDAESDGYLNVLLAGLDWWEGRVGTRTDTMLVVSVNSETGEVKMFSFPRDLQRFPIYNGDTFNGKLNSFAGVSKNYPEKFPEPGMPSLAYQLGFLLGIKIDYYASVNMEGFQEVVDIVGGITIYNDREIADDHLQFYLPVGEHRLGPADALRYVRSRKGQAGGDFARAKRQQVVLAALRREMLKPQNLPRAPEIAEALAEVINTNFPISQFDQLLELAQTVEDEPSGSWILKPPLYAKHLPRAETGGRSVMHPLMDALEALSIEVFGEDSLYNR